MMRRAYAFAVGLALAVGALAWVASYRYNLPIRDPDGLAGPSYVRLPLIVFLFYLADVVPRSLIDNRGFGHFRESVKAYTKQRWTGTRIALVVIGLLSFYTVYIAYRNLKGFLPYVRYDTNYDLVLHKLDLALMLGHDPAVVLHTLLGTGISAHVLSFVYVGFLLFVPMSLGAALVWSKNVATGFWYVTALCINWVLGAASYYWVPSLGPFYKNGAFNELPNTGVTLLQDDLRAGRAAYVDDPHATDSIQGVAAFASLHVSIIFTAALICHFVIPSRIVRYAMWVFFVLTVISTVYFGWHYLLDDLAGLFIGFIAVWIGAKTTGHQMRPNRHRSTDGIIGVWPPNSSDEEDDAARESAAARDSDARDGDAREADAVEVAASGTSASPGTSPPGSDPGSGPAQRPPGEGSGSTRA